MNNKTDIIFFSLARWEKKVSSGAISMAKEFSNTNRVYYINHPYSFRDALLFFYDKRIWKYFLPLFFGINASKKIRGYGKDLFLITPKLTWPINFLNKGKLYNYLSARNDRIISKAIKKIIKDFSIANYIFINSFDPFFLSKFPESLKPKLTIYRCTDDISQEDYITKHGVRLEKQAIQNYDITLTTGMELFHLKKEISQNVYYLPNAADISLFLSANNDLVKPDDWNYDDKPTIGYIGSIESRIDYKLMHDIAITHSDKYIVFIGPVLSNEYKSENLHEFKNVVFLNERKIQELPSYLKYLDVVLIPFKKSKLTKSIYPLKINEYLAAGKAVVATDFSEDIIAFEDVIYLGRTNNEFVEKVSLALKENNQSRINKRIEVAKNNTWTARVKSFWEILENHQNE